MRQIDATRHLSLVCLRHQPASTSAWTYGGTMSTATEHAAADGPTGGPIDRAAPGARLDVHCPVDGRLVGSVPAQGPAAVAATAAALRAAQPEWEALGPAGRSRHLLRWLDWLLDNERRILELVQAEAGKSWSDAAIEMTVAVDVINYFTANAGRFLADRKVTPAGIANKARRLRV